MVARMPIPQIAGCILRSTATKAMLLLFCTLALAKRVGELPHASGDSWAPMQVAFDYLRGPHPDRLFETIFFTNGIKFQYPPSSILYFEALRPLMDLSLFNLNALNLALLCANAALLMIIAQRLLHDRIPSGSGFALACTVFLVTAFYTPIVFAYGNGQIQLFLDTLFSGACLLMLSGRGVGAGALLGIATAIKPQFGPLLLLGLLYRHWRFVLGFVVTGGVIGLISITLYGVHNHIKYLDVLRLLSERGEAFHLNASINGIANRLLGNGEAFHFVWTQGIAHSVIPPFHSTVFLVTRIAGVAFLALPFFLPVRCNDPVSVLLHFSAANACFLLASPVAWNHHYGILLPIYLILLRTILDGPAGLRRGLLLAAATGSLLLTGLGRFPTFEGAQGWLTLLQAPGFFGLCLVFALLVVALFARARRVDAAANAGAGAAAGLSGRPA